MKKKSRIYVIGACCIAAGILVTGVGIVLGGWPGVAVTSRGLYTSSSDHNRGPYILEKTKLEEFDNINLDVMYADLDIIPSDDFYLEYRLSGSQSTPEFDTDDKTLTLKEKPNNNGKIMFFNFGGFTWGSDESVNEKYYVKLYLPADKIYDEVKISNDCGDVSAATLEAEDISLEVDYGDIDAEAIKGKTLSISMDSGNFKVKEVKADELSLDNEYGPTKIHTLDAGTAKIDLDSGDASVEKAFVDDLTLSDSYGEVTFNYADITAGSIKMDSGDLRIMDAVIGNLDVKSEYGSVDIQLRDDPASYSMKLKTEYGDVDVPFDGSYISEDDVDRFELVGKSGKTLNILCESGDINIK